MESVKMKSCGNKPTRTVMFLQKRPVGQDGGEKWKKHVWKPLFAEKQSNESQKDATQLPQYFKKLKYIFLNYKIKVYALINSGGNIKGGLSPSVTFLNINYQEVATGFLSFISRVAEASIEANLCSSSARLAEVK